MAEIVNVGTAPNAGNGDPLRVAMQKVNNRFLQFEGNVDLNQRFYGALPADPTVRPTGGAMQDGDWYLNTALNRYKIRGAGVWVLAPDVMAAQLAAAGGALLIGFGTGTVASALTAQAGELDDIQTHVKGGYTVGGRFVGAQNEAIFDAERAKLTTETVRIHNADQRHIVLTNGTVEAVVSLADDGSLSFTTNAGTPEENTFVIPKASSVPVIQGSRGNNQALTSWLQAAAALGHIKDATTP